MIELNAFKLNAFKIVAHVTAKQTIKEAPTAATQPDTGPPSTGSIGRSPRPGRSAGPGHSRRFHASVQPTNCTRSTRTRAVPRRHSTCSHGPARRLHRVRRRRSALADPRARPSRRTHPRRLMRSDGRRCGAVVAWVAAPAAGAGTAPNRECGCACSAPCRQPGLIAAHAVSCGVAVPPDDRPEADSSTYRRRRARAPSRAPRSGCRRSDSRRCRCRSRPQGPRGARTGRRPRSRGRPVRPGRWCAATPPPPPARSGS